MHKDKATYKKHSNTIIAEKDRKIVSRLSERNYIVILKQVRCRRVVLIDKNKYTEKCLSLLSLDNS